MVKLLTAFFFMQHNSEVDRFLTTSVNRELISRGQIAFATLSANTEFIAFENNNDTDPELIQQEFLLEKGFPLLLVALDSVFSNELAKNNFNLYSHIINRINIDTGEILETTDTIHSGILPNRGYFSSKVKSRIIPIRADESEGVQALMYETDFNIFIVIIIVFSVLFLPLFIFVIYSVFSLQRSFAKEKQFRQMQIDFSNALTHDMRSPLGTIAQVNDLMHNEKLLTDADKRNHFLAISQQQVENLQALTDRILTIAHSEESKLVPIRENLDITAIINQLIDKFTIQAKKEVYFNTRFVPEKIHFTADRTMLTNAISNLIDNAIKYSDESVKIDIDCRLSDVGLNVSVKDNGYGISKKNRKKIFAKFERGAAVMRKEAKGFGLGLAYVKSVTQVHNGTVNLHSKENEGTTFELFFPENKTEL
jgi:two-component system phosphate regulon sensor histidine kinase PhoR